MILADPGPEWLQQALGPAGLLVFLLVAVVWGGIKQWWVFGWQYRDMKQDREDWKSIAQRATQGAEAMGHAAKDLAGMSIEEMATEVDAARKRGDLP